MAEFLDHLRAIGPGEIAEAVQEFDDRDFFQGVDQAQYLKDPMSGGNYFGRITESGSALPRLSDAVATMIRGWQLNSPTKREADELRSFSLGVDMAVAIMWRIADRQQPDPDPFTESL